MLLTGLSATLRCADFLGHTSCVRDCQPRFARLSSPMVVALPKANGIVGYTSCVRDCQPRFARLSSPMVVALPKANGIVGYTSCVRDCQPRFARLSSPMVVALPKALVSAAPILGFFICSLSRMHSARSQIKKPSHFRSRAL